MISIAREDGTDYLYPGFLDRAMKKRNSKVDAVVFMEPRRGPIYYCQDYSFSLKDYPYKFVFYGAPYDKEESYRLIGKNSAWVTFAADAEFHKPVRGEKTHDIGFIGHNYYHEREVYLQELEKLRPRSFLNLSEVAGQDVPKNLSRCKVLFNHIRVDGVNYRFFESLALGCQVVNRTSHLNEIATEGVHYLAYSSPEELFAVVERLLGDDDLRMKIAHQARSHFLAYHTCDHRALAITNLLEEFFEDNTL